MCSSDLLDLNRREVAILAPLVVLIVFFGFYPSPILDVFHASVESLLTQHELAMEATRAAATQFAIAQ